MKIAETPRLMLRQLTQADLEALIAILGDVEVMRFSATGVMNREQIQRWLDRSLSSYETAGYGMYAAIDKASQQLIGFCGLLPQTIDQQPEVEIGYRFVRDYWGRGLATEAVQAIRDYGFGQIGLTRLICIIEAANGRSIRVAEKVGMHHEKDTLFHNAPVRIYAIHKAVSS